jgi:hypothetical protein
MSAHPLALIWSPARTFAALSVSAIVLGGAAVAAVFALLAATLVLNVGGLVFHALVAGIKVLAPLALAAIILTNGLLWFVRQDRA